MQPTLEVCLHCHMLKSNALYNMYVVVTFIYLFFWYIVGLQQFASALQNEQGQGSSQSNDKDEDGGKKADSEDKKPDKDEQGAS